MGLDHTIRVSGAATFHRPDQTARFGLISLLTSHHIPWKKSITSPEKKMLLHTIPFPCSKVPGFQSQHPCEHEQMVGRRIGESGQWPCPVDRLKAGFCLSGLRRRGWWFPFTHITCILFIYCVHALRLHLWCAVWTSQGDNAFVWMDELYCF